MIKYAALILLIMCVACSTHAQITTSPNKGEKQMAQLLKSERWVGRSITEVRDNIRNGGWRGDTNGFVNSYHLVTDPALGNVLYEQWSNGTACPDGGCNTIAYNITNTQFQGGVTFHGYVKLENIVSGRMGSHWHMGVRGNSASYTGNGGSQFLLEHGAAGGRGPDNGFFVMTTGSSGERVVTGGSSTNYLKDDIWYEFAWYIHQPSQLNRVHYRPMGTENWTLVLEATNSNINSAQAPWLGFGPYIHGYSTSWGTKRVFYGPCDFYAGDAYTDGSLGGGVTPPIDPPVDPVDPPVESTGPVITDHTVVAQSTQALISWMTDVPANGVVDYGPTAARGTIVRHDDLVDTHMLQLHDLDPATTYYYRFSSKNADGNTTMDTENSTFTTTEVVVEPEPPVIPPVVPPKELAVNDLLDAVVPSAKAGDAFVFDGANWVNANLEEMVEKKVKEMLDGAKIVV